MATSKFTSSLRGGLAAGALLAGLLLSPSARAQTTNSLSLNSSPRHDYIVAAGGGQVNAIAEMNGVLYFGGTFTEVGTNIGRAVPVDSAGNPLAGYPHAGFPKFDRAPQVIIPDNAGGWYLGGDFLNVGGTPKFRLVHLLSDFRVDPAFSADVDAQVTALFLSGTNLYVGGTFVRVTNVVATVNVATNNRFRFAVLDPATGSPRNYVGYPDLDNGVLAFAQYGNRLYLGGNFTAITNTIGVTTNITRRFRAAALDINTLQPITSFQANVDASVRCFAITADGATIYLGGTFIALTNGSTVVNRFRCAAVDATGVPAPFNADFSAQVNSLILLEDRGRMMVGGTFTSMTNDNGQGGGPTAFNRFRLAAVDITTDLNPSPGEPDNSWTPSVSGNVNWMQYDGVNLYLAGAFTLVTNSQSPGGSAFLTRRRIAACTPVDPGTGNPAAFSSFDPAAGNTVNWFAKDTNTGIIYLGGAFHNIKTVVRNRLAAVNVGTGELLPWDPNANNTVQALATLANGSTNIIYAGGAFTSIGVSGGPALTNRQRLVALTTNGTVVTTFSNNINNTVRALAVGQTNLFVGGDFTIVTNVVVNFSRTGLVALHLTSGIIYTNFTANFVTNRLAGAGTNVNALAIAGSRLFVGGGFSNVAGFHRRGLALLNPNSAAVDLNFNPHVGGTATNVMSIAVVGTNVFVAGGFTTITNMNAGGTPIATNTRNRIAQLDTSSAAAPTGLVMPWNPNAQNAVNALGMATDGTTTNVFAAGLFTTINGPTRNRFAELALPWDLATSSTNVVTSLFADLDNNAFSLHARSDRAYVGGIFTLAGQGDFTRVQPVASLAVVDFTNPLPVVSISAAPLGFTENSIVSIDPALVVSDANHLTFTNAVVAIIGGYVNGQDVLAPPSVTGSSYSSVWDAALGTLTINGFIGLYDLQQVLRNTTFSSGNNPGAGDRVIQITVTDRDGGVSLPVERTINVTPVNDAPTLNGIVDVRLVKNAAQKTIAFAGITDGGGEGQGLTVTASSSNPSVVPNPVVTYASPGTSGSLAFTPVADATGTATITVTVQDSGGTANGGVDAVVQTFTVTVNNLNTAPALNNIASLTVDQDEQVSLPLTGIDPGGNSDLTFTATSGNPAILPNPTVSYNPGGFAASTTGTLSFRSAPGANGGPVLVTLVAQNAGGTAGGGVDSVTKTFNVTVRPNVAPTFDTVAGITTNVSPGLVTVVLTGLSAGGSTNVQQSFSFTAVSDAPEVIPNPTVSYVPGQSTAVLSFTPELTAVGVATITLTATDTGGTANGGANSVTRTFTVQTTVNLQPTLDNTLVNVTLYQNPGALTAPLTGISAGPNENQQITVTATSSNPGLVIPTVAPTPWVQGLTAGTLTFTPKTSSSGTATITVTVQDNGGTQGGGVESISRSFVMTIIGGLNDTPLVNFPMANGTINTMVETNGVMYWGGTFTELGANTNITGRAVWVDGTNGARLAGGPIFDRNVNVIISDNSGGWYVGGEFQNADSRAYVRLAHLLPDRTIDPAFSANFNAAVTNLFLDGTNLYVVGGFTSLTNLTPAGVPVLTNSRFRFAVLDAATGAPRRIGGANGEPSFDLLTEQVIVRDNVAWVVGDFNTITNAVFVPGVVAVGAPGLLYTNTATNSRVKLAAISLATGLPLSLGGANGEPSFAGQIRVMILDDLNPRLYVGGDFTAVTNVVWNPGVAGTGIPVLTNSRFRLAAINTDDGTQINLGGTVNGEPGVDGVVWDLKLTGEGNTNLIVGGAFVRVTNNLFTPNVIASGVPGSNYTGVATNSRARIMALDVTPDVGLPNQLWTPGFDNVVRAAVLEGTNLYLVGTMTIATNNAGDTNVLTRRRAVKISADPDVPNVTDASWNPDLGDTAFTVASDGAGTIAIGGQFNYIRPVLRNRLAAISTTTGEIFPWNPNANSQVYALAIADAGGSNAIYAGGVFTTVGGFTRNRLAALSTIVNEAVSSNVLVMGFSNSVNGSGVRALATGPAGLYVGGEFSNIVSIVGGITNTNTRFSLAAVNQTNGEVNPAFVADVRTNAALATSITNVLALAYDQPSGNLFVGGVFGSISNASQGLTVRFGLAALVPDSGIVNLTFTNNLGGGAVSAILPSGPNLYVAGNFLTSTNGNGVSVRSRMMNMDPVIGNSNLWHSTAGQMYSMGLIGTNLYIGGLFTQVTNGNSATTITRNRIAERSTTQINGAATGWDPNLDGSVFTVLTTPTRLYIGGAFRAVGSSLTARPMASFAVFENNGVPVVTPLPGPASYVATSPASPVDTGLTVTDNNNIFLVGATVSITGGYAAGQDFLTNSPQPGITGSFDATTGVLTLTGRALISAYQAALRSVSYYNTAGLAQNLADRTLAYTVDDDFGVQGTAVKTLKLLLANEAPTLDAVASITVDEDQPTPLTLTGITAGGSDSQFLTVTAASSNPALVVPVVSYVYPDTTASLDVTPLLNAFGTATITVIVRDNGGSALGADAVTNSFTVTVNSVNDQPTLTAIPDRTVTVEYPTTVNLLAISPGGGTNEAAQLLTITAVSSDPVVIPDPTVNYTNPASAGTLTFTPQAQTVGSAVITVTVQDDGGTSGGGVDTLVLTFAVTVLENGQPTLDPIGDLTFLEDPGTQILVLTSISPGLNSLGEVETYQTLTATVTSSNPGLIAPILTYTNGQVTGTLNITPRPSASGVATITVTFQDNGGTAPATLAEGAVSVPDSITRTFTVTVLGGISDLPLTGFPMFNGQINALAEANGIMYLGGNFTETAQGSNVTGRAFWLNATNGARLAGGPVFDRNVNIIIPDGAGGWYVGGEFFNADNRAFTRLAKILPDRTIDPAFSANFDAAVTNLFLSETNLFVVGGFTRITNVNAAGISVLTNSRFRFAVLDTVTGEPRRIGGTNGEPAFNLLTESVVVGGGVAYVGGDFTFVTNMLVAPGRVAAGAPSVATYTNRFINNRTRFAAIDLATGLLKSLGGTNGEPSFDNQIRTLLLDGSRLYVGGDFTSVTNFLWTNVLNAGTRVATNSRFRLAAVDVNTGGLISLGGETNGEPSVDAAVWDFKLSGPGNTNLFVSGAFVRVTNSIWTASVVGSGAPGGNYTNIATNARVRIAALDAATALVNPGWSPAFDNVIRATVVEGTNLYVVGSFNTVTNALNDTNVANIFTRRRVVKISSDVDLPGAVDAGWRADVGDTALTLASDNSGALAIGGAFNYINPILRNRLAAMNLATKEILPWDPNMNNNVYALAIGSRGGSNVLYAGGVFTAANNTNTPKFRLAALNTNAYELNTNKLVVAGFRNGADNGVRALAIGPAGLYVGGEFTAITNGDGGTILRRGFAAVNPSNGTVNPAFVANTFSAVTTNVLAINYDGTSLFIGGAFTSVSNVAQGNVLRSRLASLDPVNGGVSTNFGSFNIQNTNTGVITSVSTNDLNGAIAAVNVLLRVDTNLYVGGEFTNMVNTVFTFTNGIPGVPDSTNFVTNALVRRAIALDPLTGATNDWAPRPGSQVFALAYSGTNVYLGGTFTAVTNGNTATTITRQRLAESSATQSGGNFTGWDPALDNSALAFLQTPGRLYVAGLFNASGNAGGNLINARPLGRFAAFENNSLPSLLLSPGPASYTATDGPRPLDPLLRVTDANNAFLVSATVTISVNYNNTQDFLTFTPQGGVTGAFDPATGVLSLTNRATIADYQAVLRSVSYTNSAGLALDVTARGVTFQVHDDYGIPVSDTKYLNLFLNNDAPTMDALANVTINEDQAASVPVTGITAGGGADQTLFLTATSSDPSIITPLTSYNTGASSGSVSITPVLNAFGTVTITVVVRDNAGTVNGGVDAVTNTFTVTVLQLNDPPTVDVPESFTRSVNYGPLAVTLTGITPGGGPDEASQSVTSLTAVSTPGSAFVFGTDVLPNPVVTYTPGQSTARLDFTPVADTTGYAEIVVTLQDNGGTANGGSDTVVKTFGVTILANTPPTLNNLGNILVNTSPGTVDIELGGITSGNEVENLAFTLTSSDTGLIPNPVVSYVQGETTALLSITPVLTAIGSANITVTLQDDGGTFGGGANSVTKTFNVSLATNAPPQVTLVNPQTDFTILEDGPLLISLENIARGDNLENGFSEVGQIMSVTATCVPAYLIAPVVTYTHPNNTASVNLQPRPNASGVGTVTITVSDNGGTAGGGVDRVVQTIRVTVLGGGITDNPSKAFPVANGTVFALAETNNVLYLGGTFTELGVNSGRAAIVDSTSGASLPFPYVDRSSVVVIPDGTGGWYLGGAHIVAGGQNKPRLAHVLADGTVDPNFNAHFDNTLRALLLDAVNNILYVGGDFIRVTNAVNDIPFATNSRVRFAALNPTTGVPLTFSAANGEPSFDAAIQSFALTGTTLYVGGDFVRVTNSVWVPGVVGAGLPGGTNYQNTATNSRVRLAALDTATALPTAFSANVDAIVRAVLLDGSGGLYVGGDFVAVTNAGIATNLARRVALLDAASGAFNPNFTAYLDARIRQMALTGGTNLFIAGDFVRITNVVGGTAVATNSRLRVAALDAATGVPNPVWKPSLDNVAAGLAIDGTGLYLGGTFLNVTNNVLDTNATVTARRRAVKLSTDVTATAVVDPAYDPAASAQVTSVAVQGSQVFLAGDFNFIHGAVRNRLAAISTATGAVLPWNPNLNSTVFALLVADNGGGANVVYAGGSFTSAGGLTRNRLAAFTTNVNDATTNVLITGFSNSFNSTVRALAVGDAGLYVGGEFTNVLDSAAVNNRRLGLAAVNPASGAINANFVADAISDGSGTNVLALAYNGTNLYVGGAFTNLSGFTRISLGAINPVNGQPNFNFTNDCNGPVLMLRAFDSNLVVGGNFTLNTNSLATTNGVARARYAVVDADVGTNYAFNPGAQARVFTTESIGTNLYLGGVFTSVTNSGTAIGTGRNRLAEMSLTTGAVTPWNPNSDGEVYSMVARGNRLYVGGAFAVFSSTAQGMLRQGFAVFESNSLPVLITTLGSMTYSTFDPPKALDPGLLLRDYNTEYITNATVQITGGYLPGEDVLALATNSLGINAAYDSATGTLSLSGFSSVENYQAALRSVTYENPAGFDMNFAPRTVTFTVGDNLALPVSATRGIQMIFSPVAPTINPVSDVVINEDEPFAVSLSGITAGGSEDQVITITVDSSAPGVVSPVLTYTSPNTTGSLNITSVPHANGTATITITVQDSGGTANGGQDTVVETFEVVVNAVNDAPTLNALASLTINANVGPQNVSLSGIFVGGGADESGQTLVIAAASTDSLLIPNPVVTYNNPDATGTLTFTPNLDATGVATLSVVVTDSGNVDFGGINAVTNTFSVTILPNAPPTLDPLFDILTNTAVTNITVPLANITAGAGGGNQTLTLTPSSSNPDLIPVPTVIYTNGNTTGQLVLAPVPSAVGTATITLVLQDTGGTTAGGVDTTTSTFVVTVTTNARPTFTANFVNLTLNEDPGTITFPLANITRGTNAQLGFPEGSQIITVAATSSNPQLITPVVTYTTNGNTTGTLNVTPRANASGTATITVTVSDNGGTVDGGVDALTRTFTVTVLPNGLSDFARNEFLVNNGQINAIVETNGVLYLGGTFTEFGTNIGKGFTVDGVTGVSTGRGPVFPVDVNAAVPDGSGGWYVGGNFPNVDNRPHVRLVHLLANRTIDPNFSANLDAAANALLLDGTNLYVGGAFIRITNLVNGVPVATNSRLRFAVLDAATGTPVALPSNPAFDNSLSSLAKSGGTLYVGGTFTNITNIVVGVSTNQNLRYRVAAINLADGTPTAFQADMDVATGRALAVSPDGSRLYMGGDFSFITNAGTAYPLFNLAAVDAVSGAPIGGFQADLSARVRALIATDTHVIVGGDFVRITNAGPAEIPVGRLVAVDAISGALNSTWFPTLNNVVLALSMSGSNLYVGGTFTSVTNQFGVTGVTRNRALALSTNLGSSAQLRTFNPELGNQVSTVAGDGTNLFLGGTFNYAKPVIRNRLAAVNPATGQLLPWNPNANNTVFSLAAASVGGSNVLYAGGQFTTVAGSNRFRLVQLSTDTAQVSSNLLVATAFTNAFNGTVRALAVGPANLYVGGDFAMITNGGVAAPAVGLVAVNLTNGAINAGFTTTNVITNSLAGGATNVNALLYNGTNLYVAGAFSNIAGATRYGLAALNPDSGALNPSFLANIGSNVLSLAASGSSLYAGGTFLTVTNVAGATNRSRLVALNPVTGSLIPGFIASANNVVQTLAIYGTNLYAGGVATSWTNTIGGTGVARNRLAELQSTIGTTGGFNPNFDSIVTAVHASGSRLYVGGSFNAMGALDNTMPIQGLAVFGTNEPPVIATTVAALDYFLGSGARPVDSGLSLVDRNNPHLPGATVSIIAGFVSSEDELALPAQFGITGSYDSGTGVLTLSGIASVGTYEAALRAVTYRNTASTGASMAARTVVFTVSDGNFPASVSASRLVQPAVGGNNAPTMDAVASVTIAEDASLQTVNLSGLTAGAGEGSQAITSITATSGNPALIPSVASIYTSPATTGTLQFTPAANANGTALITVIVQDNGGTVGTGTDSTTNTFTVTVTAVNDAPTLDAITSVTVAEDAAQQTITLTGISTGPADESGQIISGLQVTTSDGAVVPQPSGSYTSGSTMNLTFTPVPNANGVATITVTFNDNGGTTGGGVDAVTRTFTITVSAINDAPALAAINNVTNFVNSGLTTVSLTGIATGPANESGQTISSVTASSSNTGLIPNPNVTYTAGSTGSLSFTPVTSASGTATITVTVQDNGGTASGGVDSVASTFRVVILPNSVRTLTVSRSSGSNAVVSWSVDAAGFVLQSTTNMLPTGPTTWVNVIGTPVVIGTNNVVTNTQFTTNRVFYRLNRP
ncbi:MAG: hypothetical protein HZA89_05015 [Verrucomicrobia bacterium]|nr:hypothetical protein [Verrucomicrobiota bacterium]